MVVELSALLTAVGVVNSLMKETVSIVQTIRTGFIVRNKEMKQQLGESLKRLQDNLQHAGQLAEVAERYFRTREDVFELRSLCSGAEGFLKSNFDECSSRNSPNYTGNWNVLDTMFQTINANREPSRKAVLNREEWYDGEDKIQIRHLLQQFTSSYDRAETLVRQKAATSLGHELRGMTRALQDTETLLRNTIYDKILTSLQKMGQ